MNELFINSVPCDVVAMCAFNDSDEKGSYWHYFNAVATRYYLPLINSQLPRGCELSFFRSVPYGDHFELEVRANEKLLKAINYMNDADNDKTFNQLKANKKDSGLLIPPCDPENDESLKMAAFLSILGFDIYDSETQDSLYEETYESYVTNGRNAGLDEFIKENERDL